MSPIVHNRQPVVGITEGLQCQNCKHFQAPNQCRKHKAYSALRGYDRFAEVGRFDTACDDIEVVQYVEVMIQVPYGIDEESSELLGAVIPNVEEHVITVPNADWARHDAHNFVKEKYGNNAFFDWWIMRPQEF